MFKTEQLNGRNPLQRRGRKKKPFYENQILNRHDRRNYRDIEVPYFRFTNGYLRNSQENALRELTPSGKKQKEDILPNNLKDYENLCKDIHYNKDIDLMINSDVVNWEKDFLRTIHYIGRDTKSFLSLSQSSDYVISLNMVFSDKDAESSGRSIINYLLNLCDEYEFHLKLQAVPLQTRREFDRNWLKKENRLGREHQNPLLRSRNHKTHLGMVKGIEGITDKGLDSMYKLYDYYKTFGMVPVPNSHLIHFLSLGFKSLMFIEMVYPHPKLEFNKLTFPWYNDMQPSQVGSVKRTFTYQESMNFTKWIYDNRRLDLLTRNLDLYKLMLSLDGSITMDYQNHKEDKPTTLVAYKEQSNGETRKLDKGEYYEEYRTPEKSSIYGQTIIHSLVDMINDVKSKHSNVRPKELIKRLFEDVNFDIGFNGLKDLMTNDDIYKHIVSYPQFINRVY